MSHAHFCFNLLPGLITLTFNPLPAMLVTYTHAVYQGQWSFGSKI